MPDWLSWDFWAKDSQSLNHLALIIAGAIGIPLLAIRTIAANRSARAALDQAKTTAQRHDEQTKADRERRITESMAKAGEQLGSDKLETRLIGIYTLERIARESEREYWSIMETLTAYVREHAPWPPRLGNPFVQLQVRTADEMAGESTPAERPKEPADEGLRNLLIVQGFVPRDETEQTRAQIRPTTDIQAVLDVLGRLGRRNERAREQDKEAGRYLDLAETDLRGARLREAHLQGINLREAHLEGANLRKAHLEGAYLVEAHLQGAFLREARLHSTDLDGAYLQGASLWRAHLEGTGGRSEQWPFRFNIAGASLFDAHLEGANLVEAHLEGANLRKAHLEGAFLVGAVGLTQEQLDRASGDDRTLLPHSLTRPAHWPAAVPEEPDNAE